MASLALLPNELLLAILTQAAYVRSIKRALRLRLVCKRFDDIATTAIFNSSILDCEEIFGHTYRAPDFWAEYLAHQTLTHARRKSRNMKTPSGLLLIAQHICCFRYASADETYVTMGAVTYDQLRECVLELCKMMALPNNLSFNIEKWLVAASADVTEGEVDESSLDFRRHLLSAAAWIGEKNLVVKLVGEGCNWYNRPSMFLEPLRAASYRGHVDIVKFLMAIDSGEARHVCERPTSIIEFAMPNDHTELLDLALDLALDVWRHRDSAAPVHRLRLSALSLTCDLGTLIRLLEDAKPHIAMYESKWLPERIAVAATQGQADIVNYLHEREGAEVHDDSAEATSLFQSRCPAEFVKRWKPHGRDYTLLNRAARAGHVDVFKILLDAGAKHDHAIEFAAMCGSRTLVRLLWEHGENKNDAVQGAFAMAVDREDTAMFDLLEEMGAKLDDDVRAAVIKKAQEEGLESMVRLLSNNASASSEGAS